MTPEEKFIDRLRKIDAQKRRGDSAGKLLTATYRGMMVGLIGYIVLAFAEAVLHQPFLYYVGAGMLIGSIAAQAGAIIWSQFVSRGWDKIAKDW